jgi:membrane protease YdiL (CAAX protease family)
VRPTAIVLLVLGFYAFFYGRVVSRWGPAVHRSLRWLKLDSRRSVREVAAIEKLAAATAAQLVFAAGLLVGFGIAPDTIFGRDLNGAILLGAVALGFAELALTSVICTTIVEVAALRTRSGRDAGAADWQRRGRGGWMGYFLLTARAAPTPFAVVTIGLYVAVEEVIFRGVVIQVFAGVGALAAIGVSTACFVAAQAFGMPSRRAALFPMVGAAIVGIVHGVVFWHVRDVVPLAVAHMSFFATALALTRSRAPARA